MKFKVKKEILLESLNNTARAISTKNLIPILTGIKFELKEDGLYLYASDTDVSIRSFIPKDKLTSTSELGSIVIGGKYIVEIIRKLPNTDISIEVIDGYKLIVSTDNTEFNLNGINPNEFPNLDLDETKEPIVVNNGIFKDIINQTVFATSQSETRPLLTGINFKLSGNSFEVLATDSYRLARKYVEIDKDIENEVNIVVPGKNLLELTKMLDDDTASVEMHLFSNKILFKYKNIVFLILGAILVAGISYFTTHSSLGVDVNNLSLLNIIYIFFSAAIAITAMVLPGISGSTLLLIFGLYIPIIGAIKKFISFDFSVIPLLTIFGLGMIFGIVAFVRILKNCLNNYRSKTVYFILGMMIGSLYAIVNGPATLEVPMEIMTFKTFNILFFIIGAFIIVILEVLKRMMLKKD